MDQVCGSTVDKDISDGSKKSIGQVRTPFDEMLRRADEESRRPFSVEQLRQFLGVDTKPY